MTLNEALSLIKGHKGGAQKRDVFLVCGFQPLHLATFLKACCLNRFPNDQIEIHTGLYGDLAGNLEKAAESPATAAAVVTEWSDIDPRLGLRGSGGWANKTKQDIVANLRERCAQLATAIQRLAVRMPVAVASPSLPLPPIGSTICAQASALELELKHELGGLLVQLAHTSGVRVVQPSRIEEASSESCRLDAKMELLAGFPYTVQHAALLARSLAEVLFQQPPKKGLITDLDDTLWAGLVGEVGTDAVYWDQENHAQVHGLYQQMLGHLADSGVLLAVTSKNELAVVKTTLARKDLFLDPEVLFPVVANWAPKSQAVAEILRAWNIGADSVVFVDDNLMELSEVQEAFPGITCLHFSRKDPAKVWELLCRLRDLFGKPLLLEEDRLRRDSIRAATVIREAGHESTSPDFLRGLQGTVTLDYRKNPADKRALELINKTNQFNLNGARVTEGEWQHFLEETENLTITVSYQDKFGPLGKIAVLVAHRMDKNVKVTNWVMSCRAFSRQIEHHTLASLLRYSQAEEIEFCFQPTDRNQPLQEFFRDLGIERNGSGVWRLSQSQALSRCEELPHQVSELLP